MAKAFSVTGTVPTVYLDRSGNAIQGYKVYFYIAEFDETHTVQLPSLDPKQVENALTKVYNDRVALAKIGQEK